MKKTILFAAVACGLAISSANALTVSIAKGTGSGLTVLDSASVAQPTFTIKVGTFSGSPNLLLTGFSEFGSTTSSSNLVTGSFSQTPAAGEASKFNNLAAYIVIFNATATEGAILGRGTSASNTWLFPADVTSSLAPTVTLDTNNATRVAATVGSITDNASGVDNVRLVPVPEPSVTALFGLLGLVGLRRKR